ncbi:hypothetical protein XENORESO_018728 [Xenotaenia resolanae]|uniref:Uncharacterized protein n=1 Tax=Xenotaenia resolanae TaxID=208358 RepID=A0ABV0X3A4_9TELE
MFLTSDINNIFFFHTTAPLSCFLFFGPTTTPHSESLKSLFFPILMLGLNSSKSSLSRLMPLRIEMLPCDWSICYLCVNKLLNRYCDRCVCIMLYVSGSGFVCVCVFVLATYAHSQVVLELSGVLGDRCDLFH